MSLVKNPPHKVFGEILDAHAFSYGVDDLTLTKVLGRKSTYLAYKGGWVYRVEGCPHNLLLSMAGSLFKTDAFWLNFVAAIKRHLDVCDLKKEEEDED